MLEVSGVAARFVEDRISWTRVVARDADLYGKRSRHWSTADPILILIKIALAWLALTIAGVYWHMWNVTIKNSLFAMLFL